LLQEKQIQKKFLHMNADSILLTTLEVVLIFNFI